MAQANRRGELVLHCYAGSKEETSWYRIRPAMADRVYDVVVVVGARGDVEGVKAIYACRLGTDISPVKGHSTLALRDLDKGREEEKRQRVGVVKGSNKEEFCCLIRPFGACFDC